MPFSYTGRFADTLTGLQWHGQEDTTGRWYDPATGSWLSEDPKSFDAGDPNLYRYVENSTPNAIDPSGLEVDWDRIEAISTRITQPDEITRSIYEYFECEVRGAVFHQNRGTVKSIGYDYALQNEIDLHNIYVDVLRQQYGDQLPTDVEPPSRGYQYIDYIHVAGTDHNLVPRPKDVAESYDNAVEDTAQFMANERAAGVNWALTAARGVSYALGRQIGYTPAAEGVAGVDLTSRERLEGLDRLGRGGTGGIQFTFVMVPAAANTRFNVGWQCSFKLTSARTLNQTSLMNSYSKAYYKQIDGAALRIDQRGILNSMRPVQASTNSAMRSVRLDVLNAEFMPNAGGVLQNATTYWNRQLATNPGLARKVLSPAEYAAGQQSKSVALMNYGKAVERLVAEVLDDTPSSQLFKYTGGPGNGSMPDFIDLSTGLLLDITTPTQVGAKAGKWYGPGLLTPTYTRPADFSLFP